MPGRQLRPKATKSSVCVIGHARTAFLDIYRLSVRTVRVFYLKGAPTKDRVSAGRVVVNMRELWRALCRIAAPAESDIPPFLFIEVVAIGRFLATAVFPHGVRQLYFPSGNYELSPSFCVRLAADLKAVAGAQDLESPVWQALGMAASTIEAGGGNFGRK